MKPKAFFLMLTLLVVTTAACFAQTNITLVFPPGYSLAANPLNSTNNRVPNIFPDPPDYCTIFFRNPAGTGYGGETYEADYGGWDDPTLQLQPGDGFFIFNPSVQNYTNTFYGEALLCSTNIIPKGFSIRSQAFPTNSLVNFPVSYGDTFFFYTRKGNNYAYNSTTYDPDIPGWSNGEPKPKVGESFWIHHSGSATNWIICLTNSP